MNQKELGLSIPDLRHRAESGSAVAQTILGICYLEGVEVEVNHEEAFRLLRAAANQGASRAMANLAYMYAEGLGTTKSLQEALPLYEQAAEASSWPRSDWRACTHAEWASWQTLRSPGSGTRQQRPRKPVWATARNCERRKLTAGSLPEGPASAITVQRRRALEEPCLRHGEGW
jgi:hypothetical protein